MGDARSSVCSNSNVTVRYVSNDTVAIESRREMSFTAPFEALQHCAAAALEQPSPSEANFSQALTASY